MVLTKPETEITKPEVTVVEDAGIHLPQILQTHRNRIGIQVDAIDDVVGAFLSHQEIIEGDNNCSIDDF